MCSRLAHWACPLRGRPLFTVSTMDMADIGNDMLLEVFRFITCTRAMHQAELVCHQWQQETTRATALWRHTWLTVTATTVADVLKAAPEGERLLISENVVGMLTVTRGVHLRAAPGVTLSGQLRLQDCPDNDEHGVIDGLTILHFMDTAVVVQGQGKRTSPPRWELRKWSSRPEALKRDVMITADAHWHDPTRSVFENHARLYSCQILSSRRNAKASTAVVLMTSRSRRQNAGGSLTLVGCTIADTKCAISVERAPCKLLASACTFARCREVPLTLMRTARSHCVAMLIATLHHQCFDRRL